MGGEEDDRRAAFLLDQRGGFDSIALAFEADVHEHQLRAALGYARHRIFRASGDRKGVVSHIEQGLLEVFRNDGLILDHEDARRGGEITRHGTFRL